MLTLSGKIVEGISIHSIRLSILGSDGGAIRSPGSPGNWHTGCGTGGLLAHALKSIKLAVKIGNVGLKRIGSLRGELFIFPACRLEVVFIGGALRRRFLRGGLMIGLQAVYTASVQAEAYATNKQRGDNGGSNRTCS